MHRSILTTILALALLAACGGAPAPAANQSAATSAAAPAAADATTAPAPTDAPEPTAEPAAAGTSRRAPLALGTEVMLKNWSVLISDVVRGEEAAAAIEKANEFNDPPAEGWIYLLATVKITNISTEQKAQDPSFGVDIRVTGERNVLYGRTSLVVPKEIKGDLLPKGSAEGQLAFTAPADEKNLIFRVGELLSFDEDDNRYVAIDAGASVAPAADLLAMTETKVGIAREAPGKLNEPVTSPVYQVTVLEVVRGEDAAAKIKEANQFNDPAPEGQEFLLLRVHVRALAGDGPDKTVNIDSNWFKVTGEKNVVYDRPSTVPPEPSLDATLYPGGEAEGWVVVSAATGEKGLSTIIQPLLSFTDDNTRYVALE
jgi:hypothetical protein